MESCLKFGKHYAGSIVGVIGVVLSSQSGAVESDPFGIEGAGFSSSFRPSFEVTHEYDTNPYRSSLPDANVYDWMTVFSPGLAGDLRNNFMEVGIDATVHGGVSAEYEVRDFTDSTLSADALLKAGSRHRVGLILGHSSLHEDMGTGLTEGRPFVAGEPLQYDTDRAEGFYRLGSDFSEGNLRLSGTYYKKRYTNFGSLTSRNDYHSTELKSIFDWRVGSRTNLEFELSTRDIDYEIDPAPAAGTLDTLDNTTNEFLGGVRWNPGGKTEAGVLVGLRKKQFIDPDREDFFGSSWRINMQWAPREHQQFTMSTTREDRETNGDGSFIDAEVLRAGWELDWTTRISSRLGVEFTRESYAGTADARRDKSKQYTAAIDYRFQRWLDMGVALKQEDHLSTRDDRAYERVTAMFSISVLSQ